MAQAALRLLRELELCLARRGALDVRGTVERMCVGQGEEEEAGLGLGQGQGERAERTAQQCVAAAVVGYLEAYAQERDRAGGSVLTAAAAAAGAGAGEGVRAGLVSYRVVLSELLGLEEVHRVLIETMKTQGVGKREDGASATAEEESLEARLSSVSTSSTSATGLSSTLGIKLPTAASASAPKGGGGLAKVMGPAERGFLHYVVDVTMRSAVLPRLSSASARHLVSIFAHRIGTMIQCKSDVAIAVYLKASVALCRAASFHEGYALDTTELALQLKAALLLYQDTDPSITACATFSLFSLFARPFLQGYIHPSIRPLSVESADSLLKITVRALFTFHMNSFAVPLLVETLERCASAVRFHYNRQHQQHTDGRGRNTERQFVSGGCGTASSAPSFTASSGRRMARAKRRSGSEDSAKSVVTTSPITGAVVGTGTGAALRTRSVSSSSTSPLPRLLGGRSSSAVAANGGKPVESTSSPGSARRTATPPPAMYLTDGGDSPPSGLGTGKHRSLSRDEEQSKTKRLLKRIRSAPAGGLNLKLSVGSRRSRALVSPTAPQIDESSAFADGLGPASALVVRQRTRTSSDDAPADGLSNVADRTRARSASDAHSGTRKDNASATTATSAATFSDYDNKNHDVGVDGELGGTRNSDVAGSPGWRDLLRRGSKRVGSSLARLRPASSSVAATQAVPAARPCSAPDRQSLDSARSSKTPAQGAHGAIAAAPPPQPVPAQNSSYNRIPPDSQHSSATSSSSSTARYSPPNSELGQRPVAVSSAATVAPSQPRLCMSFMEKDNKGGDGHDFDVPDPPATAPAGQRRLGASEHDLQQQQPPAFFFSLTDCVGTGDGSEHTLGLGDGHDPRSLQQAERVVQNADAATPAENAVMTATAVNGASRKGRGESVGDNDGANDVENADSELYDEPVSLRARSSNATTHLRADSGIDATDRRSSQSLSMRASHRRSVSDSVTLVKQISEVVHDSAGHPNDGNALATTGETVVATYTNNNRLQGELMVDATARRAKSTTSAEHLGERLHGRSLLSRLRMQSVSAPFRPRGASGNAADSTAVDESVWRKQGGSVVGGRTSTLGSVGGASSHQSIPSRDSALSSDRSSADSRARASTRSANSVGSSLGGGGGGGSNSNSNSNSIKYRMSTHMPRMPELFSTATSSGGDASGGMHGAGGGGVFHQWVRVPMEEDIATLAGADPSADDVEVFYRCLLMMDVNVARAIRAVVQSRNFETPHIRQGVLMLCCHILYALRGHSELYKRAKAAKHPSGVALHDGSSSAAMDMDIGVVGISGNAAVGAGGLSLGTRSSNKRPSYLGGQPNAVHHPEANEQAPALSRTVGLGTRLDLDVTANANIAELLQQPSSILYQSGSFSTTRSSNSTTVDDEYSLSISRTSPRLTGGSSKSGASPSHIRTDPGSPAAGRTDSLVPSPQAVLNRRSGAASSPLHDASGSPSATDAERQSSSPSGAGATATAAAAVAATTVKVAAMAAAAPSSPPPNLETLSSEGAGRVAGSAETAENHNDADDDDDDGDDSDLADREETLWSSDTEVLEEVAATNVESLLRLPSSIEEEEEEGGGEGGTADSKSASISAEAGTGSDRAHWHISPPSERLPRPQRAAGSDAAIALMQTYIHAPPRPAGAPPGKSPVLGGTAGRKRILSDEDTRTHRTGSSGGSSCVSAATVGHAPITSPYTPSSDVDSGKAHKRSTAASAQSPAASTDRQTNFPLTEEEWELKKKEVAKTMLQRSLRVKSRSSGTRDRHGRGARRAGDRAVKEDVMDVDTGAVVHSQYRGTMADVEDLRRAAEQLSASMRSQQRKQEKDCIDSGDTGALSDSAGTVDGSARRAQRRQRRSQRLSGRRKKWTGTIGASMLDLTRGDFVKLRRKKRYKDRGGVAGAVPSAVPTATIPSLSILEGSPSVPTPHEGGLVDSSSSGSSRSGANQPVSLAQHFAVTRSGRSQSEAPPMSPPANMHRSESGTGGLAPTTSNAVTSAGSSHRAAPLAAQGTSVSVTGFNERKRVVDCVTGKPPSQTGTEAQAAATSAAYSTTAVGVTAAAAARAAAAAGSDSERGSEQSSTRTLRGLSFHAPTLAHSQSGTFGSTSGGGSGGGTASRMPSYRDSRQIQSVGATSVSGIRKRASAESDQMSGGSGDRSPTSSWGMQSASGSGRAESAEPLGSMRSPPVSARSLFSQTSSNGKGDDGGSRSGGAGGSSRSVLGLRRGLSQQQQTPANVTSGVAAAVIPRQPDLFEALKNSLPRLQDRERSSDCWWAFKWIFDQDILSWVPLDMPVLRAAYLMQWLLLECTRLGGSRRVTARQAASFASNLSKLSHTTKVFAVRRNEENTLLRNVLGCIWEISRERGSQDVSQSFFTFLAQHVTRQQSPYIRFLAAGVLTELTRGGQLPELTQRLQPELQPLAMALLDEWHIPRHEAVHSICAEFMQYRNSVWANPVTKVAHTLATKGKNLARNARQRQQQDGGHKGGDTSSGVTAAPKMSNRVGTLADGKGIVSGGSGGGGGGGGGVMDHSQQQSQSQAKTPAPVLSSSIYDSCPVPSSSAQHAAARSMPTLSARSLKRNTSGGSMPPGSAATAAVAAPTAPKAATGAGVEEDDGDRCAIQ